MPTNYKPSQAQATIIVLRSVNTTTSIGAFGSADNYTTQKTEFGDDETIMVAGAVVATDGADLTGVAMAIIVNGAPVGTASLYGYDGTNNFYQYSLGILPEGEHVVEAEFPWTRV